MVARIDCKTTVGPVAQPLASKHPASIISRHRNAEIARLPATT
jgi:hypothetical protein